MAILATRETRTPDVKNQLADKKEGDTHGVL